MINNLWMKHADGSYSTEMSMLSHGPVWMEGNVMCFHHPVTNEVVRFSELKAEKDGEGEVMLWTGKNLEIFND